MSYLLGIELGAARTSAALALPGGRPGDVEIVDLGTPGGMPTVVYVAPDGTLAIGGGAVETAAAHPGAGRLVRGAIRRIAGDPVVVDGIVHGRPELAAQVVRHVVDRVSAQDGPATRVGVTHPATWGARERDLLAAALTDAGLGVTLVPPDLAERHGAPVAEDPAHAAALGAALALDPSRPVPPAATAPVAPDARPTTPAVPLVRTSDLTTTPVTLSPPPGDVPPTETISAGSIAAAAAKQSVLPEPDTPGAPATTAPPTQAPPATDGARVPESLLPTSRIPTSSSGPPPAPPARSPSRVSTSQVSPQVSSPPQPPHHPPPSGEPPATPATEVLPVGAGRPSATGRHAAPYADHQRYGDQASPVTTALGTTGHQAPEPPTSRVPTQSTHGGPSRTGAVPPPRHGGHGFVEQSSGYRPRDDNRTTAVADQGATSYLGGGAVGAEQGATSYLGGGAVGAEQGATSYLGAGAGGEATEFVGDQRGSGFREPAPAHDRTSYDSPATGFDGGEYESTTFEDRPLREAYSSPPPSGRRSPTMMVAAGGIAAAVIVVTVALLSPGAVESGADTPALPGSVGTTLEPAVPTSEEVEPTEEPGSEETRATTTRRAPRPTTQEVPTAPPVETGVILPPPPTDVETPPPTDVETPPPTDVEPPPGSGGGGGTGAGGVTP